MTSYLILNIEGDEFFSDRGTVDGGDVGFHISTRLGSNLATKENYRTLQQAHKT